MGYVVKCKVQKKNKKQQHMTPIMFPSADLPDIAVLDWV